MPERRKTLANQSNVYSNHGGRNLDTSPPAILILLDIRQNAPHVFQSLEVYVDGGIRRGTDILKCLCLGATAVSIGRSFLYSLAYGQEGVEYLIDCMSAPIFFSLSLFLMCFSCLMLSLVGPL